MLTFKSFLSEATLRASGADATRHSEKYIKPFLPGGSQHAEGTHTIASDHASLSAGDSVTLHGHEVDEKGVHHAIVSKIGSKEKIKIPTNKLNKPIKSNNKGLKQEGELVNHLNKHGLMTGGGAGSTAGNDFHLIDKRGTKDKKISGSEGINTKTESGIHGEHKSDIKSTAFGQITLERHPKTGKWQIPEESRKKRPEYAKHVEAATVTHTDGKTRSLLDHMNHVQPPEYKPSEGNRLATNVHSNPTDLAPAHAYMRDHHVDMVHIDSHGTFRAGLSEHKDIHNLGLSPMEGAGRMRVRQKTSNPNKRTVQFSITKLNKSDTHIGTDEGAKAIADRLGHNK